MFTGIIEKVGTVARISSSSGGRIARIEYPGDMVDIRVGESISVNGVCLTAISIGKESFDVEISVESLSRSNLEELKKGDRVNLERSLKLGDRMGGHIVYGHVDGKVRVHRRSRAGDSEIFELSADDTIMRYIVFKGSVALNGISLTVSRLQRRSFEVTVLPYTIEATNLENVRPGDMLNVELDIIGKYVARFLEGEHDRKFLHKLKEFGYMKEEY